MDATVKARMDRIAELLKKLTGGGKLSTAEQTELKKLMDEQTAWERKNPDEAAAMRSASAIAAKSPDQVKAEYDAMRAKAAKDATAAGATVPAGTPGMARPTGPAPAGKSWVQTASGWVLADNAKPEDMKMNPELMPAVGMKPDVEGNPVPKTPEDDMDSFARNYQAQGDALEKDYRDFALHLRDLADQGKLLGADGKPLSMYSAEAIAKMDIPALKKIVDDNPILANQFFKRPDAETAAALEGTGRTGIGASGMVELPDVKAAPAPAKAPAQPAQAPATAPDARGYGDRTREFEEAEAARTEPAPTTPSAPATPAEAPKKKKFGEMAGELYNKYGVPILDILQAVGYQRGGITKPTNIENKYQEKLAQQERDYQKKLEDEKAAREDALYQKRIAEQRAWEAQQAELARIEEKAARGEELSSREKIAKMQIDAARASARASAAPASIIPD